jgi:dipeptidyl-peptidase 4
MIRLPKLLALSILFAMSPVPAFAQGQQLPTVAERTNFTETSRHAEVVEYCQQLAKMSPIVRLGELGVTTEGRKLPLVILADPPVANAKQAKASGKLVVFAMGNIHAGEVDGKEGLLMLMRDLALAKDRPLLKDLVIVFAPNFNADGGDRIDKKNRTHQNGPPEVGIRPNAQGFDLNRDYIKLESPEVRSLVAFFTEWDPAIVIDTHTTNGTFHAYTITYDGPRHPACDTKMVDYTRDVMLPDVGRMLEKEFGYKSNFYIDNKRANVWSTYPAIPRYGTQYVGLRNRIGILSESYVYASYKDRVLGSRDFVLANFQFAAKHKEAIKKLLQDADANSGRPKVALRHKTVSVGKEIPFAAIEGGKVAPPGKVKETPLTYMGKCEATLAVDRPAAYLIPKSYTKAIETLKRHGIAFEEVAKDTELNVTAYKVEKISRDAKAFQGHPLVKLEVTATNGKRIIEKGTIRVSCEQPLGTLAAFALEPESEDGFCAWNLFDEGLKQGGEYPVLRVEK